MNYYCIFNSKKIPYREIYVKAFPNSPEDEDCFLMEFIDEVVFNSVEDLIVYMQRVCGISDFVCRETLLPFEEAKQLYKEQLIKYLDENI